MSKFIRLSNKSISARDSISTVDLNDNVITIYYKSNPATQEATYENAKEAAANFKSICEMLMYDRV